ncbi:hypothetical protein TrST_g4842 [Triparma strigata]|uniref:Uncharacterized protein n=1 Tax=Triparma strigata TaxID=1606541 RepID=A0A9W7EN85_9STRA|nr:hypothetical protein TrST_g4842 [Triparma strigata]
MMKFGPTSTSVLVVAIVLISSPYNANAFSFIPTHATAFVPTHTAAFQPQTSSLYSTRPPTPTGGGIHSFMDGDDMDSVEGIESLGGDPSFFLDESEFKEVEKSFLSQKEETEKVNTTDEWKLGDGPQPLTASEDADDDAGWNGEVIEDAYFD